MLEAILKLILLVFMLEIQETIAIAIEISIYDSFPRFKSTYSTELFLLDHLNILHSIFDSICARLYSMSFLNTPQTL